MKAGCGRFVRAFLMALGLYTALPGLARWDEDAKGYLAPMLPAVGLMLGALWLLAAHGLARLMPRLPAAVLGALFLPTATGLLHLDGLMDVADATLSRRDRDERLCILKDPHVGAFAAIVLCAYLLLLVAAVDGLLTGGKPLVPLLLLPVISRAMAALALMGRAPLSGSRYGGMNHALASRGKRLWAGTWLLLAFVAAFLAGARVFLCCLSAAAGFCAACRGAERSLGGMNGDIAGWSICWAELCGLLAACI